MVTDGTANSTLLESVDAGVEPMLPTTLRAQRASLWSAPRTHVREEEPTGGPCAWLLQMVLLEPSTTSAQILNRAPLEYVRHYEFKGWHYQRVHLA